MTLCSQCLFTVGGNATSAPHPEDGAYESEEYEYEDEGEGGPRGMDDYSEEEEVFYDAAGTDESTELRAQLERDGFRIPPGTSIAVLRQLVAESKGVNTPPARRAAAAPTIERGTPVKYPAVPIMRGDLKKMGIAVAGKSPAEIRKLWRENAAITRS